MARKQWTTVSITKSTGAVGAKEAKVYVHFVALDGKQRAKLVEVIESAIERMLGDGDAHEPELAPF